MGLGGVGNAGKVQAQQSIDRALDTGKIDMRTYQKLTGLVDSGQLAAAMRELNSVGSGVSNTLNDLGSSIVGGKK